MSFKLNVIWWLMVAFLAAVLVIGIASEKARLDSLPPDQRSGIVPNLKCYRNGQPNAAPALPPRRQGEATADYVNRMVQWLEDYRKGGPHDGCLTWDDINELRAANGLDPILPNPVARQAPRD